MNRPVVGTVAVAILGVAGAILAYKYKDKQLEPQAGTHTIEGAGARRAIQERMNLFLPREAYNVFFAEDRIDKASVALARFDLPVLELPAFFESVPEFFPPSSDLKADPAIHQMLISYADAGKRPWWQPEQLKQINCAQRSGSYAGASKVKMKTQLATATLEGEGGTARIYIALSMETGK